MFLILVYIHVHKENWPWPPVAMFFGVSSFTLDIFVEGHLMIIFARLFPHK